MVTELTNARVVATAGPIIPLASNRALQPFSGGRHVAATVVDVDYKVVKRRKARPVAMLLALTLLVGVVVLDRFLEVSSLMPVSGSRSATVDLYAETLALNSAIGSDRVVVALTETMADQSFRTGQMCETGGWMLTPRGGDTYVVKHEYVASGPNCPAGAVVHKVR